MAIEKQAWPQCVNRKVHVAVLQSGSRPKPSLQLPPKGAEVCISVCNAWFANGQNHWPFLPHVWPLVCIALKLACQAVLMARRNKHKFLCACSLQRQELASRARFASFYRGGQTCGTNGAAILNGTSHGFRKHVWPLVAKCLDHSQYDVLPNERQQRPEKVKVGQSTLLSQQNKAGSGREQDLRLR